MKGTTQHIGAIHVTSRDFPYQPYCPLNLIFAASRLGPMVDWRSALVQTKINKQENKAHARFLLYILNKHKRMVFIFIQV